MSLYKRPRPKRLTTPEDREFFTLIASELQKPAYDPLTQGRQARLHFAAMRGHRRCRELLWRSWARWAFQWALAYAHLAPLADLWVAVSAALWESIPSWNPKGGASLGTWATMRVRTAIRKTIADHNPGCAIKHGVIGRRDVIPTAVRIVDFDPDDPNYISSNKLVDDSDSPHEAIEQTELERIVRAAIQDLSEREREILVAVMGIGCAGMSQAEMARKFGITRERVRQIVARAVKKLRSGPYAAQLEALWQDM